MKFCFIEPEIEQIDVTKAPPASYIRKEFIIKSGVIKSTLYMTALGVYKVFLNGKELSREQLLPGFTNYNTRVQYQEYDLTDRLNEGENVIGVILGDGWYRGALGATGERGFYGKKVKLGAKIENRYENHTEVIETDSSWKATQDGPIRQNDLKTYETVDFRKCMPGWNETGFDDSSWHGCIPGTYEGQCIPQEGEAILEHETFIPKILKTPDGNTVLDFGQNLAGHMEFTIQGENGQEVSFFMGETLDENGNFTIKNLQPEGVESVVQLGQCLTIILNGEEITYKSAFLISGFRYVKVTGLKAVPPADHFKMIAVYSDLKESGRFSCSDEKINRLYQNVRWSQKSNFVDIPTDCPTRERAGWTGDINVFIDTACYMTDTRRFIKKWLKDFLSLQREDGNLPYIVPKVPMNMSQEIDLDAVSYGCAGWSDALIHVPYILYQFYGDISVIEMVYDAAKRFIDFNVGRAKQKHWRHFLKLGKHYKYVLDTGFHYGEWLEPGTSMMKEGVKAMLCPDEEVATAWFYHSCDEVAKMAEILNKEEDRIKYAELAEKIKAAYQKEFLKGGTAHSKRQCKYVRPLYMNLCREDKRKKVAEKLNRMIVSNQYKIGTGFLTTYKLLGVLCDSGYTDTAYKVLQNDTCPGWMYEIGKGATTTWENWYGISEENVPQDSQNHYAPGAAMSWLFEYVCGIRALKPGFSEIEVRPYIGGNLTWAKAEYDSAQGKISVSWEIKDGNFSMETMLPEGVPVRVVLPDGRVVENAVSGRYEAKLK